MTPDFSARLTARLCHDLANPLGAIGNGLELLELSGTPATPEMALIQDSLNQANGQLRLMRLTFGPIQADADACPNTTQTMLTIWNAVARVKASAAATVAMTPEQTRMIALCLMCVENALPAGGSVEISQTKTGWKLHGTGRITREDRGLWDYLQDQTLQTAPPPSRLHFAAAGSALADMGLKAHITFSEKNVVLTLQP